MEYNIRSDYILTPTISYSNYIFTPTTSYVIDRSTSQNVFIGVESESHIIEESDEEDELKATFIESNEDCSICMECMTTTEQVNVLTCRHTFHVACLTPWWRQHSTCPLCRSHIAQS